MSYMVVLIDCCHKKSFPMWLWTMNRRLKLPGAAPPLKRTMNCLKDKLLPLVLRDFVAQRLSSSHL
ncbi:hypothetical protein H5410_015145 [Solanum commersonii]|uniref:Uncharacterized protein n=1 Tax=Solanum commersonii TaxID=4109 RepID=A0A9J5ZSZ3_SOLCO|nr:hypothetical protein H5410_015145 [Solanum commersonii]